MQDDEAHALPHPLLHPLDDGVVDLAMRHVAPPQQHIGLGQALDGQPVLRHVERHGLDFDLLVAVEGLGDGGVNAFG